ncbi:MAG: DUF1674 domain-containing protein [Pseudomonadota bacterium]|nr:DUF1674 domain-containing protein [Pseudomonadota bacterium]
MIGQTPPEPDPAAEPAADPEAPRSSEQDPAAREPEYGGREGPEPTRYGDWEKNGRCIDF